MNLLLLIVSLLLFSKSAIAESLETNTSEIKSVTPDFIKMRHAQEVIVAVDDALPNASISISPGGAYVQSHTILPQKNPQIIFEQGLLWSTTAENQIQIYSSTFKGELESNNSINIENPASYIDVYTDKLLTIEKQRYLSLYHIADSTSKLLSIDTGIELLQADLSANNICFYGDDNLVRSIEPTSKNTTKSIKLLEDIQQIAASNDSCLVLLKNGSLQLWKVKNDALILANKIQLSGIAQQFVVRNDLVAVANGEIGFTLLRLTNNQFQWAGSYNKLGYVTQVAIDDNQLLAVDDKGILSLFEISQPEIPLLISDFPFNQAVDQLTYHRKKAYLRSASQLTTINFSSQSTPMISTFGANQGGSRRSFIKDSILYVADWFSGMHLYDITIPHAPRLLSSFHTPGSPKGVVVDNNIAYVADDDHGLQIVDVSNPLQPTFVANLPLDGLAYTMKLEKKILYIASHRGGFHIVDVADSSKPKLIGTYDTPSKSWALEVRDSLLYVADDSSGLMVFDTKNPKAPKLINQFNPGGMAEDVAIINNLAYIAFFDQGLFIVDISDPMKLKQIAHLPTPGNARGIEIHDDLLYLASWEAGVLIIDIENTSRPKIIGQYDTRGATWGLSVRNKIVYAMDWWGGVKVINAQQPQQPRLIGKYQTAGKVEDLVYSDQFIYVAHGSRGIQVYDANNDLNPVWATGLDISGYAKQINVQHGTAIVAAGDEGVVFVDISNPFQLAWLSQLPFNTSIEKITTDKNTVYALTANGDIFVIDYSNPIKPYLTARIHGSYHSLSLNQDYLFAINNRHHLDIYVKKSTYQKPDISLSLNSPVTVFIVKNNFIYASHDNQTLTVYKFTDQNIQRIATIATRDQIYDIHIDNQQLFVTAGTGELLVYNITHNFQLELETIYQSAHQLEQITTSKQGIFFSGENIIASGKLLPKIDITKVGANFKLSIPATMPLGSYHLTLSTSDSAGNQLHSKKINALEIGFPKLKSKFTMEDFKRKLKEGNFSGQAPK